MELINQTKTNFALGVGKDGKHLFFKIGEVKSFDKEMTKTLLRYEGINDLESLKAKEDKVFNVAKANSSSDSVPSEYQLLKEEAKSLGLEFAPNIGKAKLAELVKEAKEAK